MAILNFTLSEEGVSAFRDALICLSKFSDDVSLEARRSSFILTTLNTSKSAYASFTFSTTKFFSRYSYTGPRERFYCTLYIRALISLFRSRTSNDTAAGPKDPGAEKQTLIERCDVAVEDGDGVSSRFIARIVFRNGLTSTHRLPFEASVPVHARFDQSNAPHQWRIASRTLRQLMDHFGPGIELLDINTDGDHVNFTCFSEKTVAEDAVLKKPLQTSIAVEVDEFDDIDVEDKLHIVISVKDFRAIINHAGSTGNDLTARYSLPSRPIQLTYASDAISCEFLIMTVGERGTNPGQRTKKGRKSGAAQQNTGPRLEAASRRTSVAPSEAPAQSKEQGDKRMLPPVSRPNPHPTPQLSARASASRLGAFDLRPSQVPPPATNQSESLFVEDEGWEPVHDPDDDEDDARLEWDHSADPNPAGMHISRAPADEQQQSDAAEVQLRPNPNPESQALDPTQRLSDVANLALFPD